eukprot:CAMPEP_0113935608 /NCGR_PEP_ID=MMETSP1339-20121228/2731_1 /TAXON_ID=94617 /ORGANISM="Fibrocapsa japonica" /LENGTH=292 /DNA_ID=CAMNT_0000937821 /DNA_START=157 /DNA_END=1035 /DNA_ORIENTATION=- /assembly_acc=CAM_ASM_000762
MTEDEMRRKMRETKLPIPYKVVVGAIAGIVGTTAIFPLDMVKTRLQAGKGNFTSPIDCARKLLAAEGIGGFYNGLIPNLVGVTPEKAIKLAANEIFREALSEKDGSIKFHNEVLSGAGAGTCQVVATTPMELVKIRMQMQATLPVEQRQSTMTVVRKLGVRGCYAGGVATLMRDVPFSIIFFPLYANIKNMLATKDGDNSIASLLAAGCAAGAVASACVTPTDVVKTRLQVDGGKEKYGNIANCYRMVIKQEGVGALFAGALPRMTVVGPLFGIALLSFEKMKEYLILSGKL